MTEQRPRPQYGEYATPQAQAEAMGVPSEVAANIKVREAYLGSYADARKHA